MPAFCEADEKLADVLPLLNPVPAQPDDASASSALKEVPTRGYVYMLKSGRHYKIGLTTNLDQRIGALAIQLPQKATKVHVIATDDPAGIERYWHGRFADRRVNGEWFELTVADVAAFKRRKFM